MLVQKCEYYADLWHSIIPQSTRKSLRNRTCAYILFRKSHIKFYGCFIEVLNINVFNGYISCVQHTYRAPSHNKQSLHKTQTIWRLNYVETITMHDNLDGGRWWRRRRDESTIKRTRYTLLVCGKTSYGRNFFRIFGSYCSLINKVVFFRHSEVAKLPFSSCMDIYVPIIYLFIYKIIIVHIGGPRTMVHCLLQVMARSLIQTNFS